MATKRSTRFLTRHPRVSMALLAVIFAVTAGVTTVKTNNYLTVLWRIADCDWKAPYPNYTMVGCWDVISSFYRTGALKLGIDSRMAEAVRKADVIVTGNSQTIATFMLQPTDNQLDVYFRQKGLRYYILAQEGSGFRFRQLIADSLDLRPRVSLINTHDLYVDLISDSNRELVFNPDRFTLPFLMTHWAIELQHEICSDAAGSGGVWGSLMGSLQGFYCHGKLPPEWLNLENGTLLLDWPRDPIKRQQILEPETDPQMGYLDLYMRRLKRMLAVPSWKQSCILFYEVASPIGMFQVSRTVAKETGRPFIFPEITPEKNWFVYDGSHMDKDTAFRWTAEFVPLLDRGIDGCLAEGKPNPAAVRLGRTEDFSP